MVTALNVEEVFSTYLYEGNGSANVIDNGINLGQSNDGGSVDFANSGSLQVTPSDASLAFTGAFTWEAFVFFKTGIAVNETIFEKTDASDTTSQRLIFGRDGGDGKFRLWITGTDVNPNTSVMNAGTWYHVALTKDGSDDFRLFIDGNLEFTYNKSGVSLSDNGIFTIGQNRDGAEAYARNYKQCAYYKRYSFIHCFIHCTDSGLDGCYKYKTAYMPR